MAKFIQRDLENFKNMLEGADADYTETAETEDEDEITVEVFGVSFRFVDGDLTEVY